MNHSFFAGVLILLFLVAGCVQPKPMTPAGFMDECLFSGGRAFCGSEQAICGDYMSVVTATQASMDECVSQCYELQKQEANMYMGENCGGVVDSATDLCEMSCRGKFKK